MVITFIIYFFSSTRVLSLPFHPFAPCFIILSVLHRSLSNDVVSSDSFVVLIFYRSCSIALSLVVFGLGGWMWEYKNDTRCGAEDRFWPCLAGCGGAGLGGRRLKTVASPLGEYAIALLCRLE